MLSLLRIENFALVDHLELSFSQGLSVLTGETGAGKSIILDAIDILLGGKANSRWIRQGTRQAILEATFQLTPPIEQWLKEQEIDALEENGLVCCRELSLNKGTLRSRCRVNGVFVNLQQIAELREYLVEITAQGQTLHLMNPNIQRDLLDAYGGHALIEQGKRVTKAYNLSQEAKQALDNRRQSQQDRLQRLDILEYQLKELHDAQLAETDELEKLEQERDRLSHVVELQQLSYQAYQILYQNDEGEAITDLLGKTESIIIDMVEFDPEIAPILEMIQTALTQVVEAGQQVNSYGDRLDSDPERLEEVEERIVLLKRICRKYGPSLAEAIACYEQFQQELNELTDSEQSLEALEKDYQVKQEILEKECAKLTELRQIAAQKLEKQLVEELKPLAMDKVIFVCQLTPIRPTAAGSDQVTFYFSPNLGEKIQPLSDTASGGEMSRFLLALKACFTDSEHSSETLIFDEIDAGVSGKVAQAIAEKLHQLSRYHQVLCVTHQPLVAAMAEYHFQVSKEIIEESAPILDLQRGESALSEIRTVIRVKALDNHATRQDELAQLTGGHSAVEAKAFAESLLVKAEKYRLGKP